MLTRRSFMKYSGVVPGAMLLCTAGASEFLVGCTALDDIETYVPLALMAINGILTILGPIVPAPVSAIVSLIQAAFAALIAAIKEYQASPTTTLEQKIVAIIKSIEDNFQTFLSALTGSPSEVGYIVKIVELILSTLMGYADALPFQMTLKMTYTLEHTAITVTPKKISNKEFKKEYNALCVQYGNPQAEIK